MKIFGLEILVEAPEDHLQHTHIQGQLFAACFFFFCPFCWQVVGLKGNPISSLLNTLHGSMVDMSRFLAKKIALASLNHV